MNSSLVSIVLAALFLTGCANDIGREVEQERDTARTPPRAPLVYELAPNWEELVDLRSLAVPPRIQLRYATPRNIAGRPLYPADMPPLLRRPTANKLERANRMLQSSGRCLVVWDALRPVEVQSSLWEAVPDGNYVGDPHQGTSLHASGVAVDVTLCDLNGRLLPMPSDFDEFGPRSSTTYRGSDPRAGYNLRLLREAMIGAGFGDYHKEWWHFHDEDFDNGTSRYVVTAIMLGVSLP